MSGHRESPRPSPWQGRRVLLGVGGGLSAVTAVELASVLRHAGAQLEVVLSPQAIDWIGAASFRAIIGRDPEKVGQIAPDLIFWVGEGEPVSEPLPSVEESTANAEADFGGFLRHLGSGTVPWIHCVLPTVAVRSPVWEWVDRGDRILRRSAEGSETWSGLRVLVTAGPTREPLDRVRYLGNRSSGRMGFALAREAWLRGGEVTLVTGPSALPDPQGVEVHRVETALEMREIVLRYATGADLAIFAAAVSDFRPEISAPAKRKRSETGSIWDVRLVENPDISRDARELCPPGGVRVGFALETGELESRAKEKLDAKGFDLIVANDADEAGSGFDVPTNRVTLMGRDGRIERLPLLSKEDVSRLVLDRVAPLLRPQAPPLR